MVSRDVATLFMVHMPDDEVRSLRDSIAKAEAELTAPVWERHRELHGRIQELKGKCEEAAHSLTIVLAGNVGTRSRPRASSASRFQHHTRMNKSFSALGFRRRAVCGCWLLAPAGPKEIDKLIRLLQLQKEVMQEDDGQERA
jgi:hypothetical protein